MNRHGTPTVRTAVGSTTDDTNVSRSRDLRALELIGGGGLAAVAGSHLLDLSDQFAEVPYLGVGYVAVIAGSVASIGLLLKRDRRGWILGGALSLASIVVFVVSRTVGLPGANHEIDRWRDARGVSSLIVEGIVVVAAGRALHSRPKASSTFHPTSHPTSHNRHEHQQRTRP